MYQPFKADAPLNRRSRRRDQEENLSRPRKIQSIFVVGCNVGDFFEWNGIIIVVVIVQDVVVQILILTLLLILILILILIPILILILILILNSSPLENI